MDSLGINRAQSSEGSASRPGTGARYTAKPIRTIRDVGRALCHFGFSRTALELHGGIAAVVMTADDFL